MLKEGVDIVTIIRFYISCYLGCQPGVKAVAFLGLVFLILSPVIEVVFVKLIVDSFLEVASESGGGGMGYGFYSLLALALSVVYSVGYASRVGRIRYINHVVEMLEVRGVDVHKSHKAWMRAVLVEATQILIWIMQLLAILGIAVYMNSFMSLPLVVMMLVSSLLGAWLFSDQVYRQRRLKYNKRDGADRVASMKVHSRVKSVELMGVVVNVLSLFCFLFFVVMVVEGYIGPDVGVVFIFIARIFKMTLSGIGGSLMRLARASVYSEKGIEKVVEFRRLSGKSES